jgi:TPR repeat protein
VSRKCQQLDDSSTPSPTPTPTPTPTPLPDYNEGKDAYWDEDYKTALALLTPFAEDGDADAQHYLGNMYSDGKGVPENDKTAVEWYTLAAEQGHEYAQLYLGWSLKFGYRCMGE